MAELKQRSCDQASIACAGLQHTHQARGWTVAPPQATSPIPCVLPDRQPWLDVDRRRCRDIVWEHVNPHVQGALGREGSTETSRSKGLVLQGKPSPESHRLALSIPSASVTCDWVLGRENGSNYQK